MIELSLINLLKIMILRMNKLKYPELFELNEGFGIYWFIERKRQSR